MLAILMVFALYGMFNITAAVVVVGCGLLFFLVATIGYNPQRSLIRRAPSAA